MTTTLTSIGYPSSSKLQDFRSKLESRILLDAKLGIKLDNQLLSKHFPAGDKQSSFSWL